MGPPGAAGVAGTGGRDAQRADDGAQLIFGHGRVENLACLGERERHRYGHP
jgi:hypothetical protein